MFICHQNASFPLLFFLLVLLHCKFSTCSRPRPYNLNHSHANKRFIEQLEEGSYEIVHPFQVRDRKERVGIDTRNHFLNSTPSEHYRQITLVIRSSVLANARLKLLLALNEHILHRKSRLRMLKNAEESVVSPMENCYYQGTINGNPDTFAAISTCDGLLGILAFPNGTSYAIWPLEGGERTRRHPHVLYRARIGTGGSMCAAALTQMVHSAGEEEQQVRRTAREHQQQQRRVTKFVELALIGDQKFMLHFNLSHHKAVEYAMNALNLADLILRRDLGISLNVPFAEFWSDSQRIEQTEDAQQLLGSVLDYSTGHIYDVEKDATVVLTGQTLSGGDAMIASFGSVCTSRAVALIQVSSPFTAHLSAIMLAHSIGHVLGIDHDSSECSCGSSTDRTKHCIMAEKTGPADILPFHFSQCSIARLQSLLHQSQSPQLQCLFVRPFQTSHLYQCGNGVLDADEQCDCGRRDQCDDPCCDPLSCQLKAHAQCGSHQPCCQHCQLRSSGHVCRQSQSTCDVAEKCDGLSGECPLDVNLVDGMQCGLSGHCWKGDCVDGERQCRELWGSGAKLADELCFAYNSRGVEYGNCGRDGEGRFIECASENSQCGILHCRGGNPTPIVANATSFNLQFTHKHRQLQCKVVTNSPSGLARDGNSCGPGRVCVQSVCVPLAQVSPPVHCPSNNVALQCSGHGDCTTGQHCLCFDGWISAACDVFVPNNSSRRIGQLSSVNNRDSIEFMVPTIRVNRKALETATLLGILLLVGFLLLLLLICLLFFYKRKSSTRSYRGRNSGRAKVADEEGCGGEKSEEEAEDTGRAIKFGQMPSYREEKRKRKKNKKVYDALQRITEANEADSLSVKSRESSSVGVNNECNRIIQHQNIEGSHIGPSSAVYRMASPNHQQHDQIRYSTSPSNCNDIGEGWGRTRNGSVVGEGSGGEGASAGGYAMDSTELVHFGVLRPSESGPIEQLQYSASPTGFVAPPRLAHIQMLMRRLEGTISGGMGTNEAMAEEDGGQHHRNGGRAQHSPSLSNGFERPPASADSGRPGSTFDMQDESPSLFSDPYKLDRLDLPG